MEDNTHASHPFKNVIELSCWVGRGNALGRAFLVGLPSPISTPDHGVHPSDQNDPFLANQNDPLLASRSSRLLWARKTQTEQCCRHAYGSNTGTRPISTLRCLQSMQRRLAVANEQILGNCGARQGNNQSGFVWRRLAGRRLDMLSEPSCMVADETRETGKGFGVAPSLPQSLRLSMNLKRPGERLGAREEDSLPPSINAPLPGTLRSRASGGGRSKGRTHRGKAPGRKGSVGNLKLPQPLSYINLTIKRDLTIKSRRTRVSFHKSATPRRAEEVCLFPATGSDRTFDP